MDGLPAEKVTWPRVDRVAVADVKSPRSVGKASRRQTLSNAGTTVVSARLQSPRRPTIDPLTEAQLTRNRLDVEFLVEKIERAMECDDCAAVEVLRLQLKAMQQHGIEALEKSQRLQACRQEIKKELEITSGLKAELDAARQRIQELEVLIEAAAGRASDLATEMDTLLGRPASKT